MANMAKIANIPKISTLKILDTLQKIKFFAG
jgi:hypothetical protein